jgi:DUF4097 and DUF4098 domain-containing protein YvlB
MAFAIILSITIIFGIVNAVGALISVATGETFFHNSKDNMDNINFDEDFTGVKSLDIDISTGSFQIKSGDTVRVEAKNVPNSFKAEVTKDGTLSIDQSKNGIHFWGFNFNGINSPSAKIILYLPADFTAENAFISTGAGSVSIEELHSKYLTVSTGTGSINGNDMSADNVDIDGGVGSSNFREVSFKDAEIKCGVGSLSLQGELLGDNSVDCGVGGVNLNLKGKVENYELDVDAGIGTVRVNGEKIKDKYKDNNNAANSIEVNGGIGSVNINFDGSGF